MITRNVAGSIFWSVQARTFISRHVFEPRLIASNPVSPEGGTQECDPKKPVILLLGWAGAKDEHVEKYAKIYNDRGYRTVSFTSPCYHYRIPNSRYGFYISPLFRGINAKPGDFTSYKDSPIIAHIFSMNGVRSLISLWKWTEAEQREELRERIKGVIFDSAPGVTQAGPAAHAVVLSTPPIEGLHFINQNLRTNYIKTMFKLRNAIAHPLGYIYPPIRAHLSQYYYLQKYVKLPAPQLYIYSEADHMVRQKYITNFVDEQRRIGNDVQSLYFPDTAHVKHFVKYPEQYEEACMDLVRRTENSLRCHNS